MITDFYNSKKRKNNSNKIFLAKTKVFSLLSASIFISHNSLAATFDNNQKATLLPEIKVVATKDKPEFISYKTTNSTSSTHTKTDLLNVPQSITIVNQEQIRDQNITNMEEAVRYIPGVNIQQGESNRDQVTIRGNTSTADFFVDGIRDDAQYFRDFYNIENVEFLKGPNAMAFGRGGSGGVINRVTKYADGKRKRTLNISGGSFDNRRAALDLGDKVTDKLSLRLNTVYEKSGTFRKYGDVERYGFNPTATLKISKDTNLQFGYEHFVDQRFNDRGIPSQNGEAYKTKASTFYGNPNENYSQAQNDSVFLNFSHDFSSDLQINNKTRYIKNSKFYQNVYANSAVNDSNSFNLAAYNNKTDRNSFINRTDLTKKFNTGSIQHVGLLGLEITKQDSRNMRNTGYFNNLNTSRTISAADPLDFTPITYRQSASDINNITNVDVYSLYAQDQVEINKYLQFIAGARFDRFAIDLTNYRNNNQNLKRIDDLFSPRLGIILKPEKSLSIYGNYSVSYLPSSGDQFGALTDRTQFLKPEKIQNREIGFKWDVNSKFNLSSALYELNRTNSPANDPNNAGFYILNGESRIRGFELTASGQITNQWQTIAGYSFQEAKILSGIATSPNSGSTASAKSGNKLALTPHNKLTLWNKYDFNDNWAAAIGIINQSGQYAASDNAVRLKGFTRFDGAIYYKINPSYRLQLNVENIFNNRYNISAHNNYNIQPGSVRAFKVNLIAEF